MSGEYETIRRIRYNGGEFVPVCEKCGRFVKAPETITFDYREQPVGNFAECSKCGPTTMPFEGYP